MEYLMLAGLLLLAGTADVASHTHASAFIGDDLRPGIEARLSLTNDYLQVPYFFMKGGMPLQLTVKESYDKVGATWTPSTETTIELRLFRF